MRHVPFGARIAAACGMLTQIGSGLLAFGILFFWVFFPLEDLAALPLALVGSEIVPGRVVAAERTGASEGNSPVYRIRFEARGLDEEPLRGYAYQTGDAPAEGAEVTITYPAGIPALATIEGMRRSTFGLGGSFVAIFPGIGAILAIVGLRMGLSAGSVLGIGKLALGTLVSKTATNTRVNNRTVYKLTFRFQDESGQTRSAEARTSLTEKLEDEAEELLLYDPDNPSRSYLLDAIPGGVVMDSEGRIASPPAFKVLLRLLLPGIATFAVLSGLVLRLTRLLS